MRLSKLLPFALALVGTLAVALPASAAEVGKPAPGFDGTDSHGKKHTLADYKGKWLVLEWLNHGCPYVRKHYDAKNMQALQAKWTDKGVAWLSVISSAEGKQGYSTPDKANEDVKANAAKPTAVLLDPKGVIGKAYDAKTTPHMVIINPEGVVVYDGAIDSIRSADQDDIAKATPYVDKALEAGLAGKAIDPNQTTPYGCSVKYP
ncbi:MAG: thioredoxin family protein [Myxococcales bacterium]|nr:thioredoxin family protein [Myxococcales bacterium]